MEEGSLLVAAPIAVAAELSSTGAVQPVAAVLDGSAARVPSRERRGNRVEMAEGVRRGVSKLGRISTIEIFRMFHLHYHPSNQTACGVWASDLVRC